MAFLPMMCFHLFRCKSSIRTNNYFIDSTKIVACYPKRVHQNQVFNGIASWGKTSSGWFYGIKIHFIINNLGEIIQTCFTTGSTSDTNIGVLFYLLKDLSGWVLCDKGYLMNNEKLAFVEYEGTLDLFAKPRNNTKKANHEFVPNETKKMAKRRPVIETVIGLQKRVLDLEHTRHRSALNAFTQMLAAMCAYCFTKENRKFLFQTHKALKQYNGLITA